MKPLQKFWFASAPIDLEMKQYILLDFLQSVREDFTLDVLYPWLSEVQKQHADLTAFNQEKKELQEKFKKIKKFNKETLSTEYEYDNSWITKDFEEVSNIVEFSTPKLYHWLLKGTNLFDTISRQMKWNVVGLIPAYKDEGYFILHINDKDIFVYRFKVKKIIFEDENFFGITTDLVDSTRSSLKNYEDLKHDLMKRFDDLSCPYTLSIQSRSYPLADTLLPVLKRNGLTKIKNGF
jgi:hypothetical protein